METGRAGGFAASAGARAASECPQGHDAAEHARSGSGRHEGRPARSDNPRLLLVEFLVRFEDDGDNDAELGGGEGDEVFVTELLQDALSLALVVKV